MKTSHWVLIAVVLAAFILWHLVIEDVVTKIKAKVTG